MSEGTLPIRYQVSIEGAEEATEDISDLLGSVSRGIGLVASLDYTFMSWQRTAEKFDIMSFMRATISTINLIQQLIRATQLATAVQTAYNAALAIGQALTPWGWVALGVGAAVGIGYGASTYRPPSVQGSFNLGKILEAERRLETEELRKIIGEKRRQELEGYLASHPK